MKQKLLCTVLVNTEEALENCLKESPTVFCVEEPLFSDIHQTVLSDTRFQDYEIRVHLSHRFILFLRCAEPRRFDPFIHRFIYHPIIRD